MDVDFLREKIMSKIQCLAIEENLFDLSQIQTNTTDENAQNILEYHIHSQNSPLRYYSSPKRPIDNSFFPFIRDMNSP